MTRTHFNLAALFVLLPAALPTRAAPWAAVKGSESENHDNSSNL